MTSALGGLDVLRLVHLPQVAIVLVITHHFRIAFKRSKPKDKGRGHVKRMLAQLTGRRATWLGHRNIVLRSPTVPFTGRIFIGRSLHPCLGSKPAPAARRGEEAPDERTGWTRSPRRPHKATHPTHSHRASTRPNPSLPHHQPSRLLVVDCVAKRSLAAARALFIGTGKILHHHSPSRQEQLVDLKISDSPLAGTNPFR